MRFTTVYFWSQQGNGSFKCRTPRVGSCCKWQNNGIKDRRFFPRQGKQIKFLFMRKEARSLLWCLSATINTVLKHKSTSKHKIKGRERGENKVRSVNIRVNTQGDWIKDKQQEENDVRASTSKEGKTERNTDWAKNEERLIQRKGVNRWRSAFRRRRCWSGGVEAEQQWWIVFTPLSVPSFILLVSPSVCTLMSSPLSPLLSHSVFCFALPATCPHWSNWINSSPCR